jgi:hypothetical protein
MTVHEAIERLDELASADDDIRFRGRRTEPSSLPIDQAREADTVTIRFWTIDGAQVTGTLADMVADRERGSDVLGRIE